MWKNHVKSSPLVCKLHCNIYYLIRFLLTSMSCLYTKSFTNHFCWSFGIYYFYFLHIFMITLNVWIKTLAWCQLTNMGIHILINPKIITLQESSIFFSFIIEHYKITHQKETWKLKTKQTTNSASKEVERSHWCLLPNQIWNTVKKKKSLSNINPYKPKPILPLCKIFYWSLFKALIENLVYSIHHLWIWDNKSNLWI
jgi:hypothetical protein